MLVNIFTLSRIWARWSHQQIPPYQAIKIWHCLIGSRHHTLRFCPLHRIWDPRLNLPFRWSRQYVRQMRDVVLQCVRHILDSHMRCLWWRRWPDAGGLCGGREGLVVVSLSLPTRGEGWSLTSSSMTSREKNNKMLMCLYDLWVISCETINQD